ncbi:hypothetical protein LX36DRAFT_712751 [Colletotrichum falcatum]|nr:hypothetical protein LX36DRAFT_712751 [Colletotrichum falcatum]
MVLNDFGNIRFSIFARDSRLVLTNPSFGLSYQRITPLLSFDQPLPAGSGVLRFAHQFIFDLVQFIFDLQYIYYLNQHLYIAFFHIRSRIYYNSVFINFINSLVHITSAGDHLLNVFKHSIFFHLIQLIANIYIINLFGFYLIYYTTSLVCFYLIRFIISLGHFYLVQGIAHNISTSVNITDGPVPITSIYTFLHNTRVLCQFNQPHRNLFRFVTYSPVFRYSYNDSHKHKH